jgi:hypothetical protein
MIKKTWHYKAWHGMTFSYITLQYHSCKHGMYYVHVNLCTYLPIYLAMLHASVPTLIHWKKYITRPYIKKSRRNLPNYVALHCIAPRNSAYFFLFHTLQCIHYKHYIHVMHATTACKQPTYQTKPYHYTRHKHYKHFKHYIYYTHFTHYRPCIRYMRTMQYMHYMQYICRIHYMQTYQAKPYLAKHYMHYVHPIHCTTL